MIKRSLSWLRAAFFAGLLVVIPLVVTMWVLVTLIGFVDNWLQPQWFKTVLGFYPSFLPVDAEGNPVRPPGLGAAIAIVGVLLLGTITRSYVGRSFVNFYEGILGRVPVLSSIYQAIKELMEMLMSRNSGAFQKVVLVEWPRKGLYSVGFQTGTSFVTVPGEGRLVNVFLPTTPNPTTGFFFMLPADRVVFTELTIEQGFKLLMSAGLVPPGGDLEVERNQFSDGPDGAGDPGPAPVLLSATDLRKVEEMLNVRAKTSAEDEPDSS